MWQWLRNPVYDFGGQPHIDLGTSFLQQVVDGEILLYQRHAASQGVSRFLRGQALQSTVTDPIVLAQVVIDRIKAVVCLASDDVRFLAFGISLPANNALMSQSSSDIVQSGAPGNERVGLALMLGQQLTNPTAVGAKHLCEIAVGKQSPLLVSLFAQTDCFTQQSLASRQAIDTQVHVLGSGDVEQYWDQLGIGDALVTNGRVVDADGHPEYLTMGEMVFGTLVLGDNFEDHVGAELADAGSADAWELLDDPVGECVPQGFLAERSEAGANRVRLFTHGWSSHE